MDMESLNRVSRHRFLSKVPILANFNMAKLNDINTMAEDVCFEA